MLELITPTVRLRDSWLEARSEWGAGAHQPGSGLQAADDVDTAGGFASWIERLLRQGDESVPPAPGLVPASYWWIVEADAYLGAISLRHRLNDFLLRAGGHIGYGVRPSARSRGVACWALGTVVRHAHAHGIERVLVTCDDTNLASARTIARAGGVLEDIRVTELGLTRRYWISR